MEEELKQYRWLISSCFQKSIRRGRNDLAQEYLQFLWECDRNYITFRFGTILSEDIGIANHDLVLEYLQTNLGKKKIEEKGGLHFLSELTEKACESVKDRSSCDAAYTAHFYSTPLHSKEEAIEVFNNNDIHYIDRINAGWSLLGGKKFKSEIIDFLHKGDKDNIEEYLHMVEKLTNKQVAEVVKFSYGTQRENIGLGTSIVESLFQQELLNKVNNHSGGVIENIITPESTIFHKETGLQLINCGLDGHTREGKNVYFQYLKNNSKFSQYIYQNQVPYEQHIEILKHCLFRVEGHEVNKRIYFPSAVHIMRDCEQLVLNLKAGLPENTLSFKEIKKMLLEDLPQINQMKEDSLKNKKPYYSKNI